MALAGGFWAGFYLVRGAALMGPDLWGAFSWLSFAMLLVCFVLPLAAPRLPWLCPLLAFFAIGFGVGADAMTDRTMDRNLWGIEAILAQALGFPGAVIGGAAGTFLSTRIWNRMTAQPSPPPVPRDRGGHSDGDG